MIIFDLRCGGQGHVFEAWFGSTEDYEDQKARGLVSCPVCGTADIDKAPMAPAVPRKGNAVASAAPPIPSDPKQALAMMAALQKKLLEGSENVGDRFADEARAIHIGEADARAIHGRTSPQEAQRLADEGVPVAPLPLPVVEPDAQN